MKKSLLILGASGGVAGAFLLTLPKFRHRLNKLVLLDNNDRVKQNPFLNHRALNYIFLKQRISFPARKNEYLMILKKYGIDLVLDLTDADSLPALKTTDSAGVGYINTSLNQTGATAASLVYKIFRERQRIKNAPHVLCAGMNPGNVNVWVSHGIKKFGVPKEIIHFEYDTSMVSAKWQPMISWSRLQFLEEGMLEPSGIALGKNKIKKLLPNALKHLVDMKVILEPVLSLSLSLKNIRWE